jgi:hypothetical protein
LGDVRKHACITPKDLAESAVQGILWYNGPSNPTFATRSIHPLLALHHQAKDIVFRFIIEYSKYSLRDFVLFGQNLYEDF